MSKDLCTEYTAVPGRERQVESILRELGLFVQSDPSALLFLPFAVKSTPGKYLVFERFLNEQACHAHLLTEQRRQIVDELCRHTEDHSASLTWLHSVA